MLSGMCSALWLVCVWERLDLTDMLNHGSSVSPGSHEQTGPRMGLEEGLAGGGLSLSVYSTAACS